MAHLAVQPHLPLLPDAEAGRAEAQARDAALARLQVPPAKLRAAEADEAALPSLCSHIAGNADAVAKVLRHCSCSSPCGGRPSARMCSSTQAAEVLR